MKKLIISCSLIITGTLFGQTHYINKLWEKESALLSGQQNHARTLLDQNDNILTVFNKKNNQAANIFSNKINSNGIETWQTEITNFLNLIGTENHGTDIKKDAVGNIYICGANFNGSNYDYLIVKYNTSGSELWRKAYNGTANSDDVPSSLALDASGNVYVTGVSYGQGSMTDFATLKINGTNGNIIWTSRYDFSNKYDGATQIKLDNQGNVLVCGSSAQNLVNSDFVVIKYNPNNGNQLQIKRHNTPQNGYDIAIGMEIDANNNVYVVGTANSNLQNKDIKIIAYNTNLQINWVKYIDESGLEDEIYGIAKNAYGDLILTGSTKDLQNQINLLTAKISKINGSIIWKKIELNQNEVTNAVGKGVGIDLNGNVVVVSEILKNNISFIQAVSYNPDGLKRWEYINENINLTNQKALDILVKGNDVIITGTNETTAGETLITIKLEQKEIIIVPDFNGEPSVTSFGLETNQGQLLNDDVTTIATNVKFYNERMNPAVFITDNNIVLGFQQGQADSTIKVHRIDMDFVGSNPVKNIINLADDELAGIKNYYLRHKTDGYLGIKEYARIIMTEVYPNIDVQYYSGKNGMKYYIDVKPGANPEMLLLKFSGANNITLNGDGSLNINSAYGNITFNKPIAYQLDANNQTVQIQGEGDFIQVDDYTVKFFVRTYQIDKPLFIQLEQFGTTEEPPLRTDNLKWSTYYGGANFDEFNDVTTDDDGNVYFTGSSNGLLFPNQTGISNVYQQTPSVRRIVCGSHFSGGVTRWVTLYGAELDIANAITTDNQGNVYITGVSSYSYEVNIQHHFITQNKIGAYNLGATNPGLSGNAYAFIIQFKQDLGSVPWSTLFGEYAANALYNASSISCDVDGNVFIAGRGKRIANGPILATGAQYMNAENNVNKGFIAKFSANSNALEWSTLFGNEGTYINGIEAFGHSNLMITGETSGTDIEDFPIVEEHPALDYLDETYNGGTKDAFIAHFDAGNALLWSTLFGGSGEDFATSISISDDLDIAIGGLTQSPAPTFPLQMIGNGFPITEMHGDQDAFLTVFHIPLNSGYELKYSTYWGENEYDIINKVKYSEAGHLYLFGSTNSPNFGDYFGLLTNGFMQLNLENDMNLGYHSNAFLFALQTSDYRFQWGTYFGGKPHISYPFDGCDDGKGIAVHFNKLYICGETNSQTNFPLDDGDDGAYYQGQNGSGIFSQSEWRDYADGFIAEFDLSITPLGTTLGNDELLITNENNHFMLYPNPNNGELILLGKPKTFDDKFEISILDLNGQLVKKFSKLKIINFNSVVMDVSDLPSGFYNLMMQTSSEALVMKLIKN